MIDHASVKLHYEIDDLPTRILAEMQLAGLDKDGLTWQELAPFDQFHVRGLAATEELAQGLRLEDIKDVLDVGSGIGGPARYLAAVHGCQVTGIDLSQAFVDTANMLAAKTGLTNRVRFQQADALNLPFPDAAFDHAITQHVAMNIADRPALYKSIHRVLKPGGRLAIYDIVAGNGEPLHFPVPWARTPDISFLITPGEMRQTLTDSGFAEVSMTDKTQEGLAWFADQLAALKDGNPSSNLNLSLIMGPDFPQMAANVARNIKEGKAALVQAVFQRNC